MKLLHGSSPSCQGTPPKELLARALRLADDIQFQDAEIIARNLGGSPDLILQAGYRIASGMFKATFQRAGFALPRFVRVGKTVVLPCLNERGEITSLHDQAGQWLLGPATHIANSIRAPFAEVEVCETTSQADSLALSENICAVARNGCDQKAVAAAVLAALRSKQSGRLAA